MYVWDNQFTPFGATVASWAVDFLYHRDQTGQGGAHGICDGTKSVDGNVAPTATYRGYPCLAQPGRQLVGGRLHSARYCYGSRSQPHSRSDGTANGAFGQIFNYQITASGSPISFGASGLPAGVTVDTVTGAISGTANAAGTFNATISASNAGGTGMAGLVITIAKATQTITFNAQSLPTQSFVPGGSFAINPAASGGASGNLIVYSSTTPSVCQVTSVVTMLTAGTCTIAANQAGDSNYLAAPQVTQNVSIAAVAPGAPVIGGATPGNTQAQIAFTPPAQNGGSAIIDFTATCVSAGQTTRTGTGASSPLLVTSLANTFTYSCTVTARNSAGNSAASGAVLVTPAVITVPDAPIIGLAVAGDGSASIAFSPPANNGGAAITQYNVTCSPGGFAGSGNASPVTVNGLANAVTYSCVVTASNSAGPGAPSAAVDVTPEATIALVAVQSRKTHGANDRDVQIIDVLEPITGQVTVEPRSIGTGHRIVFQFDNTVTSVTSVTATNALGQSIGSATPSMLGNELTITLGGISDNTRVKVSVTGVNGSVNASASIGFLVGDVNGTRSVNASDISAVKANLSLPVGATNFRMDFDANGTISQADVSAVKARSGLVLLP